MSWRVRHQGSPKSVDGLTLQQVVEGLTESQWEPTDEVMGPQDQKWVSMEQHPQLADIVADLEPPLVKPHPDETKLDMNPLIDVALVLLIFFILTATYSTLRKILEMPEASQRKPGEVVTIEREVAENLMITVKARKENGQTIIQVQNETVAEEDLLNTLRNFVTQTRKTELLLEASNVDWGTVVTIQDAAKGANIRKVYYKAN